MRFKRKPRIAGRLKYHVQFLAGIGVIQTGSISRHSGFVIALGMSERQLTTCHRIYSSEPTLCPVSSEIPVDSDDRRDDVRDCWLDHPRSDFIQPGCNFCPHYSTFSK